MRPFAKLLSLSLLAACAVEPANDDTAEPADAGPAVEDRLADWLVGDFDSADQAKADPQYYAISMRLCPVDLPALGARVLYIEQATVDDLASPYRQRLYVVDAVSEDMAVSRVYEARSPSQEAELVGLCEDPAAVTLDADAFDLREGCDVVLAWASESCLSRSLRKVSPLEYSLKSSFSARRSACVPFPEPGFPKIAKVFISDIQIL